MRFRVYCLSHLFIVPLLFVSACLAGQTYTDPAEVDEDYAYQGEYRGEVETDQVVGVQLVARGGGMYEGVFYLNGLPGQEADVSLAQRVELKRDGDTLSATQAGAIPGDLKVEGDEMHFLNADGETAATIEKVYREGPSMGAEPPEGAVVLFDGSGVDQWQDGAQMTEDGLLVQGVTSKEKFQSQRIHLEFRLPYQPEDTGQGRGNSGVYVQGRYEVQVLDSFGLEGLQNECGGIYSIGAPKVNMCLPPLVWQTYDIEFRAAQYDEEGNVVAEPRMTVLLNGIAVQESVELPHATTAAPLAPGPEPGPLYLQDHGNPVRYRNVWVLPLED